MKTASSLDRRIDAALVIETNNLRGRGAPDAARAVDALARLLGHLRAQTLPLASLTEVVITHDEGSLGADDRARLERAAGVPLAFVAIPPEAGYYTAKNLGFDATRAALVAFGDGDCWPAPRWLEALLAPFDDPRVQAVAGRTAYRDDALGRAASAIDFLYFDSDLGPDCTRNFYANNVAFRREVFGARRYHPLPGTYRGHCQVLGMRLHDEGVAVRFAPAAHTVHRLPDSARELVRLRLLRGSDTAALAPHIAQAASSRMPRAAALAGRLGPLAPLAVLAGRFAFSARELGHARPRRPLENGKAFAALAGLSLLDAAGALARPLARARYGIGDGTLSARGALGYHHDRDGLAQPG